MDVSAYPAGPKDLCLFDGSNGGKQVLLKMDASLDPLNYLYLLGQKKPKLVVLVADRSGSMACNWYQVLKSAEYFETKFREASIALHIVQFNDTAQIVEKAASMAESATDGTDFKLAFAKVEQILDANAATHDICVVFLSDGKHSVWNSHEDFPNLTALAQKMKASPNNTVVHVLGFTDDNDYQHLTAMTCLGKEAGTYKFIEGNKEGEDLQAALKFTCDAIIHNQTAFFAHFECQRPSQFFTDKPSVERSIKMACKPTEVERGCHILYNMTFNLFASVNDSFLDGFTCSLVSTDGLRKVILTPRRYDGAPRDAFDQFFATLQAGLQKVIKLISEENGSCGALLVLHNNKHVMDKVDEFFADPSWVCSNGHRIKLQKMVKLIKERTSASSTDGSARAKMQAASIVNDFATKSGRKGVLSSAACSKFAFAGAVKSGMADESDGRLFFDGPSQVDDAFASDSD